MVPRTVAGERVIGVDLGGTKILSGLIGRDGRIVRRYEIPTPIDSQEAVLGGLDAAVEELLDGDVAALGYGIPSTIDQSRGVAVGSVNVPLADVAFRDRMHERFQLPVGIDNDANAAAIAEWRWGAGRGANDLVMLTLGTGIGGGLILSGRPYRGSIGTGAELGHIVVEHDGPPCKCGGHGHLEAVASGRAADRAARELYGNTADSHELVRRARAGEGPAREALGEIGRKLGSGIGSLVNAFDPELVIIGGGFAEAGELVLGPAREQAHAEALPAARDRLQIVRAELGPEAGVLGAALVGFEALEAA
jgi:glucokinase